MPNGDVYIDPTLRRFMKKDGGGDLYAALAELNRKLNAGEITAKEYQAQLDALLGGETGPDLVTAIARATSDPRVQLTALMAALLESGSLYGPWKSDAVTGTHHGPFQIGALSFEEANDPARAVKFMMEEHLGGESTFPKAVEQVTAAYPNLWRDNPALAAALSAYLAERPEKWTVVNRLVQAGAPIEQVAPYIYSQGSIERAWQQLSAADFTYVQDLPPPTLEQRLRAEELGVSVSFLQAVEAAGGNVEGYVGLKALEETARTLSLTAEELSTVLNLREQGVFLSPEMIGKWKAQWRALGPELSKMGITAADLAMAVDADLNIPQLRSAKQLGIAPAAYRAALSAGLSDDGIWAAVKLGQDPTAMTREQILQLNREMDFPTALARMTSDLPPILRNTVASSETLEQEYANAATEARVAGKLLTPADFLAQNYPLLSGRGLPAEMVAAVGQGKFDPGSATISALKAEIERITGRPIQMFAERRAFSSEAGYKRAGIALPLEYQRGVGGGSPFTPNPLGMLPIQPFTPEWAGQPGGMLGLTEIGSWIVAQGLRAAMQEGIRTGRIPRDSYTYELFARKQTAPAAPPTNLVSASQAAPPGYVYNPAMGKYEKPAASPAQPLTAEAMKQAYQAQDDTARKKQKPMPVAAKVGALVKAPGLFTVGEEGEEYALLAPGSVVAPKPKGEPATADNAVRALKKMLDKAYG